MDFFSRQEQSRRSTRYLVVLFAIAFLTVAIATAIAAIVAFGFFADYDPTTFGSRDLPAWLADNAARLFTIVAVTMGAMILASLFRAATLSRGGGQVARMLGGTQIDANDTDLAHRRLVNVVEEMAIASGVPVPEIYVLEQEDGINAFAAGLTPADAAIAVTRGSLERLNRAELQGVIAHEFSHVLNGDMRLNQRLIGFSFGILVLSLMGRWLLRSSRFAFRSRDRGTSVAIFIGLALTIIGGIGVLLSRLIKAAVSRQRESLADASAVQFTRDPLGLAGALKKIGGYTAYLSSVETEEVAHMLFGRGARSFSGLFATHPPLEQRILALDPSFKPGDYVESGGALPQAAADEEGLTSALAQRIEPATFGLESAGQVGSPEVGAVLRTAIPEELYHAAHSKESSFLLVLALLLAPDEATLRQQRSLLEGQLGTERTTRCVRLHRELAQLDRRLWIPLLEISVPALKQRPTEQLRYLAEIAERLSGVDERLDLFEYVLLRTLGAYLAGAHHALAAGRARGARLSVDEALYTVLATVAAHGHTSAAEARAAYRAGVDVLVTRPDAGADAILEGALADGDLTRLDTALDVLEKLSERAKRQVLAAVLATIRHDRKVEIAEMELFRAIAASLGCPMPPAATIR